MSVTRVFEDYDPATGKTVLFHYEDNGRVTLETLQDVEPILNDAQRDFNSIDERARWGEFQKIGTIPMPLYMQMRREGILQDPKALAKFFNDRDNLKLRTRPGRV
jgi:hypothetical protein